eukprot:CAMPEP_0168312540 /NCGR_PEP_ID=MMETSP0142_2-20121227/67952_1 /TAXON_ID=44445 /ORGANISM="Pseudo-nitzschia australis, Strain 10249 10 AB" /LENGTH=713 /DNA_ID=CAMNT_0008265511 /DNA_START=65 /DNA_END=2203 /DNA_ORIENTATION=+
MATSILTTPYTNDDKDGEGVGVGVGVGDDTNGDDNGAKHTHQHRVARQHHPCCSCLRKWWTESLWPGMGLFGESYLLFSIGTLTPLWRELYPNCFNPNANYAYNNNNNGNNNGGGGTCSPRLLQSLTYGVVLGVVFGMVLLGYLSDRIGRRKGSILTATLMAMGSLGLVGVSSLAAVATASAETVFRGTVACLVLFGIGVGGEYPLSASLASERATEEMNVNGNRNVTVNVNVNTETARNQALLDEERAPKRRQKSTQPIPMPMIQSNSTTITRTPGETDYAYQAMPKTQPPNSSSNRGRRVQLVFAMQGMGIWFNSLIMLFLFWILKGQSSDDDDGDDKSNNYEYYSAHDLLTIWRVTYGIGAAILCFVMLSRILYLEESKVWLKARQTNRTNSNSKKSSNTNSNNNNRTIAVDESRWFRLVHQQYGSRMFGAGMAWLLWDISFYGNKLFQSTFLEALVGADASLLQITAASLLNATVALAGYYCAAFLIDVTAHENAHEHKLHLGRKQLQSIGFLATGALFVACGWLLAPSQSASSSNSNSNLTVVLYLLSSFVGQLGPNCTTFLIPAEIVPTDQRTYCHGVCAAAGKVGALIAAVVFHFVGGGGGGTTTTGSEILFYASGAASLLAALVTYGFVPETSGLDFGELDLQWKLLLLHGADNLDFVYRGPASHANHTSVYERYCRTRTSRTNNEAHAETGQQDRERSALDGCF